MSKWTYDIPELTEEEKSLPIAKYYYNYPLHYPNPLYSQLLDQGAMNPADAQSVEHCFDHLRPEGYAKVEYGYCMMTDGTGYIANYSVLSDKVTPGMREWYVKWLNIHSKNLPEGVGNIRYKLWNQADHVDHGLVEGDFKKGIYTLETLDMGRGRNAAGHFDEGQYNGTSQAIRSVRHNFDVRDYGFSEEAYQELEKVNASITSCWESFEVPGSHLVLSITRPCPLGGVETLSREWIGYKAENGKIIRDPETPDFMLCEQYLRDVQIHNTVEQQHLSTFLPQLYAEYHDLPADAD